jgi:hypothetical protein
MFSNFQPLFFIANVLVNFVVFTFKFSLPFQIPYLASIFYVFLLHLSGSTGSLRPLLDTGCRAPDARR